MTSQMKKMFSDAFRLPIQQGYESHELEVRLGSFKAVNNGHHGLPGGKNTFIPCIPEPAKLVLGRYAESTMHFMEREFSLIVVHTNEVKVTQILAPPLMSVPNPTSYTLLAPWEGAAITGERYQKKSHVKYCDDIELGFRMSLNLERTTLTPQEMQSVHDTVSNPIKFVKLRARDSFRFGHLRLDLSSFRSSTSLANIRYAPVECDCEIELMSMGGADSPGLIDRAFHDFMAFVETVLKLVQKQPFTMNPQDPDAIRLLRRTDTHRVLAHYAALLDEKGAAPRKAKDIFLGVQPQTVKVSKLNAQLEYAVTHKLDGIRVLVFIDRQGEVFLLTGRHHTGPHVIQLHCDRRAERTQCVIDAEILDNVIYCFDLVCVDGLDLRGHQTYPLRARLALLDPLLKAINGIGSHFQFLLKPYLYGPDLHVNMKTLLDQRISFTQPCDGLIMVPAEAPYPRERSGPHVPLKWKPSESITIDFLMHKISITPTHEVWSLHQSTEGNTLTEFAPELVAAHEAQFEGYSSPEVRTVHLTMISRPFADTFQNQSIIECSWHAQFGMFIPLRKRHDKDMPNFKTVCEDNWESIVRPVTLDVISELFSKKPFEENQHGGAARPSSENEFDKLMDAVTAGLQEVAVGNVAKDRDASIPFRMDDLLRFLHFVKRKMIARVAGEIQSTRGRSPRLLDITQKSQGNDVMKWVDHNIKSVVAYVHPHYFDQAQARLDAILAKPTIKNFDIRLVMEDSEVPMPAGTPVFDMITCHEGLNEYVRDDVGIDNLVGLLKINGDDVIFMAIAIDWDRLQDRAKSVLSPFAYNVLLEESVDTNYFFTAMEERGYECVEAFPLDDLLHDWHSYGNVLNSMDTLLMGCHSYLILKKIR